MKFEFLIAFGNLKFLLCHLFFLSFNLSLRLNGVDFGIAPFLSPNILPYPVLLLLVLELSVFAEFGLKTIFDGSSFRDSSEEADCFCSGNIFGVASVSRLSSASGVNWLKGS